MNRPSWDKYFMRIAREVATRSRCVRRNVGAVGVLGKENLARGYNGAPSGLSHCIDIGCLREKLNVPSGERHELCRGLHAEQNAFLQAAKHGVTISGATLYTTYHPCVICSKMAINAGIRRIVSRDDYPDDLGKEMLAEAQLDVVILGPEDGGE
ncbi:MAG: cytidine/deoxycytidylate deaminase family protein [Planctomycetia bacterium]|nr:cytidine/deoxycytidylate deaminase family protein [Planctomycetia bacterium]